MDEPARELGPEIRKEPAAIDRFVQDMLDSVREEFVAEQGIRIPRAIVVYMKDDKPALMIVGCGDAFSPANRSAFAHAVSMMAQKVQAFCVFFVCEAYAHRGTSKEEHDRWAGRLHECPDADEVVMVMIDHLELPQQMWTARIENTAGKKALGPWTCLVAPPDAKVAGRFVSLLRRSVN
jgi:hypothetical protein